MLPTKAEPIQSAGTNAVPQNNFWQAHTATQRASPLERQYRSSHRRFSDFASSIRPLHHASHGPPPPHRG
jgi:hypothetical protein